MQYNNVTLGLTTLAVALFLRDHEFLGGVVFSLALNFKQMALYYAPAVGVFLLARCVYRPKVLLHVLKLSVAVVTTFALLWLPFCLHPFEGETCATSVLQGTDTHWVRAVSSVWICSSGDQQDLMAACVVPTEVSSPPPRLPVRTRLV